MNQISQGTEQTTSIEDRDYTWGDVSAQTWVQVVAIGALFFWFFGADIIWVVSRWINDPTWSHGFLIPMFSLYFLHQKRNFIINQTFKPSWYLGLVFFILCLLLYPLNLVQFKFFYGRAVLMILTLAAMVFFMGGRKLFRYTWLPVFFLFFSVPLPERLYAQITIPMRKLAAEVSVAVLNIVPNLKATANGVVIDVIYKGKALEPALDVAEACSGMRLLMAFVALGVAMAYLHDRPIWQRLVLLASTIPIAILCNVIRVTITGLIYVLGDPRYAQGIYHDMLGLLMLPLAFALYGLIAWLMGNIFTEEETQPEVIIRRSTAAIENKEQKE